MKPHPTKTKPVTAPVPKRKSAQLVRLVMISAFFLPALGWFLLRPYKLWEQTYFSNRLIEQVSGEDETEAMKAVAVLNRLDRRGLKGLALGLNSNRWTVADAADRAILTHLIAWREDLEGRDPVAKKQAVKDIYLMAALLNENTEAYGENAKQLAAKIARSLALMPIPFDAERDGSFLVFCEQIASLNAPSVRERIPISPTLSADEESTWEARPKIDLEKLAAAPGNHLQLDPQSERDRFDEPFPTSSNDAIPHELGNRTARDLPTAEKRWQSISAARAPSEEPLPLPSEGAVAPDSYEPLDVESIWDGKQSLAELSLLSVMKLLHADAESVRDQAIQELKIRGLSREELAAAYQLTSAKIADRIALVEILPSMKKINPDPWLFFLAEDAEADVRYTALSTLATSSNPQTRAKVMELSTRDSDERIAELARRMAVIEEASRKRR